MLAHCLGRTMPTWTWSRSLLSRRPSLWTSSTMVSGFATTTSLTSSPGLRG
ncbi:unnamed protein product [Symbiodinium microadriaticum]|nr:unnamed protein product [Symbiodinium microadriaticum]CAE7787428.1 unnamed protein product [Symbiodinium sp. KB8]